MHVVDRSRSRQDPALSVALEKANADTETHGEFESECPGYCGAPDTFYVGTLKGMHCQIESGLLQLKLAAGSQGCH